MDGQMDGKGQLFPVEEFQLINVEGQRKTENHH